MASYLACTGILLHRFRYHLCDVFWHPGLTNHHHTTLKALSTSFLSAQRVDLGAKRRAYPYELPMWKPYGTRLTWNQATTDSCWTPKGPGTFFLHISSHANSKVASGAQKPPWDLCKSCALLTCCSSKPTALWQYATQNRNMVWLCLNWRIKDMRQEWSDASSKKSKRPLAAGIPCRMRVIWGPSMTKNQSCFTFSLASWAPNPKSITETACLRYSKIHRTNEQESFGGWSDLFQPGSDPGQVERGLWPQDKPQNKMVMARYGPKQWTARL